MHPRSTDGADREALTKMACSKSEIEVDSPDCEDGSNKLLNLLRFLSCCTEAIWTDRQAWQMLRRSFPV